MTQIFSPIIIGTTTFNPSAIPSHQDYWNIVQPTQPDSSTAEQLLSILPNSTNYKVFDSQPPTEKNEVQAITLSVAPNPILNTVLSEVSPGTAQIVSEMKDNPDLGTQILDKIESTPKGTTVGVVLPEGHTVNVDVHEVKDAVDKVVNIHVADVVLNAEPKIVDNIVNNMPPNTAKEIINLVNNNNPKDILETLNNKTTPQNNAVQEGLQQIAFNSPTFYPPKIVQRKKQRSTSRKRSTTRKYKRNSRTRTKRYSSRKRTSPKRRRQSSRSRRR